MSAQQYAVYLDYVHLLIDLQSYIIARTVGKGEISKAEWITRLAPWLSAYGWESVHNKHKDKHETYEALRKLKSNESRASRWVERALSKTPAQHRSDILARYGKDLHASVASVFELPRMALSTLMPRVQFTQEFTAPQPSHEIAKSQRMQFLDHTSSSLYEALAERQASQKAACVAMSYSVGQLARMAGILLDQARDGKNGTTKSLHQCLGRYELADLLVRVLDSDIEYWWQRRWSKILSDDERSKLQRSNTAVSSSRLPEVSFTQMSTAVRGAASRLP